jgi:plasmid stability protein
MPKTVQIRNLDDDVYAALVKRAAETGISVPELLRIEATRLAARPSMAEWLKSVRAVPRRSSAITTDHVIATLDEWRGPWPDAGD